MSEANIVIATPHAAKYAAQLLKHWSHRNPDIAAGPQWTSMTFGATTYIVELRADALVARITAADDAALGAAKGAFQEHIDRFAFRETPALVWNWR